MKNKKLYLFLISLFISIIPVIIFSQNDVITTSPQTLDEYIREGKTKTNRFFYDEAKAVFEEALKFYPEDWRLNWYYLNLLDSLEQSSNERGSTVISYYEDRVKENPKSPTAYAGLAYGYLKQYKMMVAEEMTEKARGIAQQSLAALHIHAIVLKSMEYHDEKKKDMALKAYNDMLQNYPDFFEGYQDFFENYKYNADFKTNSDIDFSGKWDRALKCKDFDPIIYLLETRAFKSPEDEEKYTGIYEKILQQDSSRAYIKFSLAKRYLKEEKREKGLDLLKDTVGEAPNYEEASTFLANIYSSHQKYELSSKILKSLMENSKNRYSNYGFLHAKNLYRSGRFDEAVDFLEKCMRDVNYTSIFDEEKLLTALKSRKHEDGVKIISGIPFMVQKWNYCGPASVSMILQYWGLPFDQDQIAESIYIKGMGTIPKTAQNYINSLGFRTFVFKGSDEIWKKALDLNIPVLLVIRVYDNAHAVVIGGYDDFTREFIIHDPNLPYADSRPYTRTGEKSIFLPWREEILQCMLIIPEDVASRYDFSFIKTPFAIQITNLVSHILMGSAILSGLVFGLLVNGTYVLVILLLAYLAIRKTIFPYSPRNLWRFLAICLIVEFAINATCALFYSETTAAVLIAYHGSMILFLLICVYSKVLHIFFQFYVPLSFYIRIYPASIGLGVLMIMESKTAMSETFVIGLIVLIVLVIFYPLIVLVYFKSLVDNRKYSGFFKYIRKLRWIKREQIRYLCAGFMESIVHLQQGEYDKSLMRLDEIFKFPFLSRQYRFRIKTLILENLLEKLKEHAVDREEISIRVESLIEEIKSSNPKGWNKFILLLLSTDFYIIRGNYDEALYSQEEADKIFNSKNIFIFFQKKLENIRYFVERLRSVNIHYDLNRLELARHFERNDIIEEILRKYKDKLDLDFKRYGFLQDLTRQK